MQFETLTRSLRLESRRIMQNSQNHLKQLRNDRDRICNFPLLRSGLKDMPNNLEGAQKGDTHDARTFSSSPHMPPAVY